MQGYTIPCHRNKCKYIRISQLVAKPDAVTNEVSELTNVYKFLPAFRSAYLKI